MKVKDFAHNITVELLSQKCLKRPCYTPQIAFRNNGIEYICGRRQLHGCKAEYIEEEGKWNKNADKYTQQIRGCPAEYIKEKEERMNYYKEKILEIKPFFEEDNIEASEGVMVSTNKQKIILSIGANQDCSEIFGYFWCNDNPQDFIGAELFDVVITDKALNEIIIEKNKKKLGLEYKFFEDEAMFVNLKTNKGVLQFVVYNIHNGWYGHKIKVSCSQLNIEDYM